MVNDRHISVYTPCHLLVSVHFSDGRAQLVTELNAVCRAMNITLQLSISQVAKPINAEDNLVKLKDGLVCTVMSGQSTNLAHQNVLTRLLTVPQSGTNIRSAEIIIAYEFHSKIPFN